MYEAIINMPIGNDEVPSLRVKIGWGAGVQDYPAVFERCNFWVGVRNENGELIGFGYVCGMGIVHGYMEDIIVHPDYQNKGIGTKLVKKLLEESVEYGLSIVTVTFEEKNAKFYKNCGFDIECGGVHYTGVID